MSNKNNKMLVIGSFMMDHVFRTSRIPKDGETIIGTGFRKSIGGKGVNQAIAASRLGSNVTMVGKVGKDEHGKTFLSALKSENIDTTHILSDERYPTGISSISLDEQGNNRIIVIPGANIHFTVDELNQIKELIEGAGVVLLQLEMDIKTVEKAIEIANSSDVPVILNPAPAQKIKESLYNKITFLTPNETEAGLLTGVQVKDIPSAKEATEILQKKGTKNVIITLGEQGALIKTSEFSKHVPGFHVKPIDTVGAGDSFNAGLAHGFLQGKSIEETIKMANAVGALTTTKEGIMSSLPKYDEVKHFLENYSHKYSS